jgi:hypothetical protein
MKVSKFKFQNAPIARTIEPRSNAAESRCFTNLIEPQSQSRSKLVRSMLSHGVSQNASIAVLIETLDCNLDHRSIALMRSLWNKNPRSIKTNSHSIETAVACLIPEPTYSSNISFPRNYIRPLSHDFHKVWRHLFNIHGKIPNLPKPILKHKPLLDSH